MWSTDVAGPEVALRLGVELAARHRARVVAPRASTPWPLLPELPPALEAAPWSPELEEVLDTAYEPAVLAALSVARAAWARGRTPLSAHGAPAGGLGDPAWDLACAEAHLADAARGPTGEVPVSPLLRAAYAAAGGPVRLPSPAWACVRALVTAWDRAADPDPVVREAYATCLVRARLAAAQQRSAA